jgi:hypothetical protein
MADNKGEELFELYMKTYSYDALYHHPDLGTPKRPDYLVGKGHQRVVVEVESFNTAPLSAGHSRSGFVDMRPKLSAVRNKISAGAAQLKGISNYPLVVVLVNPINSNVPLEGGMFLGALFGDPLYEFTEDGGQFRSGRNGRLEVAELDGSVHGNHPYLSAVAVLRFIYTMEAWAEAMGKTKAAGYLEPLSGVREMNRIVSLLGDDAVEGICLDVYETVSESAVPLPRDFFAEPNDTRWGIVGTGQYWQIGGPRA